MSDTPKDYPFDTIVESCCQHLVKGRTFHQKFTCAKCGSRQTMEEANKLFTSGKCEECGYVTNIRERGCSYLLTGSDQDMLAELLNQTKWKR